MNEAYSNEIYQQALKDSKLPAGLDNYSRAKNVGISFDASSKITTFALYSPYNQKQDLYLRIWVPIEENTLLFRSIDVRTKNDHDGYFFLALEGLYPGCLYQLVDEKGKTSLPLDAEGIITSNQGNFASIIDHNFEWVDSQQLKNNQVPAFIDEVHIETLTPGGRISDFEKALRDGDSRFTELSMVELMPLHVVNRKPLFNANLSEGNQFLRLTPAEIKKTGNFGYEKLPYLKAIDEKLGIPANLKSLVNLIHQKDGQVCLDLQLAFMACGITSKNDHVKMKESAYNSPYGPLINLHDEFVFWWTLFSVKYFLETYHIDAIRLDSVDLIMNSINKPQFMKQLGELLPEYAGSITEKQLTLSRKPLVIAEATQTSLQVRESTNLPYTWDFELSEYFKNIYHALKNGYTPENHYLRELVEKLLTHDHSIVMINSHDRLGSETGKPQRDPLLRVQETTARGLPMEFDANFFHFFKNREGIRVMIDAFIEKSNVYNTFTQTDWDKRLKRYLGQFYSNLEEAKRDLKHLRETIFVGNEWSWKKRLNLINEYCKNSEWKEKYSKLANAHFELMHDLSSDQDFNRDSYYQAVAAIEKKIRLRHPWLTGGISRLDEASADEALTLMRRANPLDSSEQVLTLVNYSGNTYKRDIELPQGKWNIYHISSQPKNHGDKIKQKTIYITADHPKNYSLEIAPKEGVIVETDIDNRSNGQINYQDIWQIYMQASEGAIKPPAGALTLNMSRKEVQNKGGLFKYKEETIFFGFDQDGKILLFSDQKIPDIETIYINPKDNNAADLRRISLNPKSEQFKEESSEFKHSRSLDIGKLGIQGTNTKFLYLVFADHHAVEIYIP